MKIEIDSFFVENEPDLWKAREWASSIARIRVIETVVGAYGAIDHNFGTTYFDVGDYLVRLGPFRQIIVVSKETMQSITPGE